MVYKIYCDGHIIHNPQALIDTLVLKDVTLDMEKKLEGVALVISKFSNALIKIAIAIMLVANIPTDRLIIGAGVLVLALSAITVLAIELAKTKNDAWKEVTK